ncbi:MAG: carboxypeptidase-like regulatory domain-containing protein, partial [Candidatus Aminicenantes bacterium]
MNRKLFKASLILLLALAMTSITFAQGRQTGSIHGVVVDTEGNVLPGCSVTLTGPALIGQRNYLTSDTGSFRFPALSPGSDYQVRVE